MSVVLSRLAPAAGSSKKEKRFGRGIGSGLGKTCGKGSKGQKARHGGDFGHLYFQGGQTPIQRRIPKRGFRIPFPVRTASINVSELERFDAGTNVDEKALRQARLVQGRDVRIKVLGDGELKKKLVVSAHSFSASARQKIEQAGGKVVLLAPAEDTAEKPAE